MVWLSQTITQSSINCQTGLDVEHATTLIETNALPLSQARLRQLFVLAPTSCCHMGTAMQHPVPDRVKQSFVMFDIRAL